MNKGETNEGLFMSGRRENDNFCSSFSFVISRISEYKNGNSNEDFGQRHEAF